MRIHTSVRLVNAASRTAPWLLALACALCSATVQAASAVAAAAAAGAEIHVPADFPTIQQAIDAGVDGDSILVAPGTYHESLDLLGKRLRIGGTAGAAATIVDAGGAGSVVLARSGEPQGTLLSGLTLTGGSGHALADGSGAGGGAIYAANASQLLVQQCVLSGNTVAPAAGVGVGGAVFATGEGLSTDAARVSLLDCTLSGNVAQDDGGAVFAQPGGEVLLDGCTVTANRGGGSQPAALAGASVSAQNSLIARNVGSGAVQAFVRNCVLDHNTGWGWIMDFETQAQIFESSFLSNREGGVHAGALDPLGVSGIQRCVFSGGNGVDLQIMTPLPEVVDVRNCTFDGGVLDLNANGLWMRDCILRNGAAIRSGGSVVITWSDVEGGFPGDGNIDADPKWVDAAAGDYGLAPGSPCIDAGNAGNNDIDGSTADMGAIPFQQWTRLGGALAGSSGKPPVMAVSGALTKGSLVRVTVIKASKTAPSLLVIGASRLATPFKGGTLIPSPDHVLVLVPPANPTFPIDVLLPVPTDLPHGAHLWLQCWTPDASAPAGFAATDAWRGDVP